VCVGGGEGSSDSSIATCEFVMVVAYWFVFF